jgi:hypothetical protein
MRLRWGVLLTGLRIGSALALTRQGTENWPTHASVSAAKKMG